METAKQLATYADILALEEEVRAEIVAGEIVIQPAPLPEHGRVQRSLGRFIGGPFDDDDGAGGPGGWWIMLEVDVEFEPHEVVRPDLAGWRRERLVDPWGKQPIRTVPDWICEVLSPSNARHDRVHKAALYERHGVGYYWIVEPRERLLEAFQLREECWVRLGAWDAQCTARIPPFDDIELDVGRFFPPVTPPGD